MIRLKPKASAQKADDAPGAALPSTPPLPDTRLELRGIACRRGGRVLFEDLSLTLRAGEALRILGPNGAGKTSLLRLLAGLLRPGAGELHCLVDGAARPAGRVSHLLSHLDAVKPGLTVSDALGFWSRYAGGGGSVKGNLDRVGLGDMAAVRCGDLSAGQRRRLNLARLTALPRPIWLLDEPTAALDAAGQELLTALIAEHRGAGGLVVAATHLPLDMGPARSLRLDIAAA